MERRQLLKGKGSSGSSDTIPATVGFRVDRKKGGLSPHTPNEKMLIALRKALADMSDADEHGCRYYIKDNRVKLLEAPSGTEGKPGEPVSYKASGRCRVGVCHPDGTITTKAIEFRLAFSDSRDDLGQPDVVYEEDTVIDEIPKTAKL